MRGRLRQFLLPALQLGMQACWLYAWLATIEMRVLEHTAIASTALAFAAVGALARSYLEQTPLKRVARMACFWLAWLALSSLAAKLLLYPDTAWTQPGWFFALPRSALRLIFETQAAELLLLCGSACAWYLGGRAVSVGPSHNSLLAQFQFGLVMLVTASLTAHQLGVSAAQSIMLALVFFILALSGIAATRSRQQDERAPLPTDRHFAGSLLSLIAIVSVLGLLAGVAITPSLIEVLLDAGRLVLHALESAAVFIATLLPEPEMVPGAELQPPATGDDAGLLEFYRTLPWPALLRRIVYIVWIAMMLGILVFALWRICSMVLDWLKRRSNLSGIEIEKLDTGLLADLLALLLWLARKARRLALGATRLLRSRMGTTGEPTWGSVYDGLVRWAGRKLIARAPSQSAHEYQATLCEFLPLATPDLALVTETYVRARYGRHQPDSSTIAEMQNAVQRIRKMPRRSRPEHSNTQTEGAE